MLKPPLALSVVAIDAGGSETTWWSGDKYAYNRPQSLSFRTRIGEGFSDAGATLARRIDQDYNDLELFNDIVAVGDDGQIAYEGRIGSTPRSTSGGHSIAVQCAGWMAHAKDPKFTEIYVDRGLGAWGVAGSSRRAALVASSYTDPNGPEVMPNEGGSTAIKLQHADKWAAPVKPLNEAWYDAGSNRIGAIWYDVINVGSASIADANWAFFVRTTDSDTAAVVNASSTDIWASVPISQYLTDSTGSRYGFITFSYEGGAGGADAYQYSVHVRDLAVYGTHGLTRRGGNPGGLYTSDVLTNIAQRFCPKLNTAGVEGTTLVIPHIVFKDRTTPFDAFLVLNGPHGYELAVWENKTLYFRPYDLSDYDWQVRMDQPGVDLSLQGDTTDQLANYVVVEFDNVATGKRDQVSPSDDSSLEDTTVDHPANRAGFDVELTVGLTFPTTQEVAIAFGQSYLNEFNRPKNRGQITVEGHILDRAGHWIQPWRVRAGETISVVDHPNDLPRLITETSYDHSSRTVTISTDSGELNMVEAVVDYIRTSLTASGLG